MQIFHPTPLQNIIYTNDLLQKCPQSYAKHALMQGTIQGIVSHRQYSGSIANLHFYLFRLVSIGFLFFLFRPPFHSATTYAGPFDILFTFCFAPFYFRYLFSTCKGVIYVNTHTVASHLLRNIDPD